jgi:cell division protein FtsQ
MRLDSGMQLALGREHTRERLDRFVQLYPRLFGAPAAADQTVVAPVAVDLRYADGFAVRMPDGRMPASFAPPPALIQPSTT